MLSTEYLSIFPEFIRFTIIDGTNVKRKTTAITGSYAKNVIRHTTKVKSEPKLSANQVGAIYIRFRNTFTDSMMSAFLGSSIYDASFLPSCFIISSFITFSDF